MEIPETNWLDDGKLKDGMPERSMSGADVPGFGPCSTVDWIAWKELA